ncbi:hypothetical protein E2C01_084604 [Portunus trituberculatus]|uniref:Uncharacterized protein n=1 Tax=Portunus trituberculatus TaxID=210409 RepID=A0A5B7IYQ9_PORTR|nr:hypothetical protein [Portunus trituberculatus]
MVGRSPQCTSPSFSSRLLLTQSPSLTVSSHRLISGAFSVIWTRRVTVCVVFVNLQQSTGKREGRVTLDSFTFCALLCYVSDRKCGK